MIDHQTHDEEDDLAAVKQSQSVSDLVEHQRYLWTTDPPNGSLHEITMARSVHQFLG